MSYQCKIKCQGKDGDQGITGPTGFAGPTGSSSTGPTGFPGPTGPGVTGATGPDGSSSLLGFIEVYSQGGLITVNPGDPVPFIVTGPITTPPFTHDPGSPQITVSAFGVYDIQFSVTGVEGNQFGIAINGAVQAKGIYGTAAGQNNGEAMLVLFPGNVITLVNTSGIPITFTAAVGGLQPTVNASMHILQVL